MPDDEDYRALADLLDHPEAWSSDERTRAEFLLRGQRDLVEAAHPADERRREHLRALVAAIEAAIAAHDRPSSD